MPPMPATNLHVAGTRQPRARAAAPALRALALAACGGFAWLLAAPAFAEKADRNKPTQIDADSFSGDELKQTGVYSGNVVVVRGTLRMTGERLELKQDPEGYRFAVITVAPGKLATFRQRRDPDRPGIEEHVEGMAERIEYDEKADTVRFVNRAVWRRLENGEPRDELSGSQILYDSRNSRYTAGGSQTPGGNDRTRTILAPRSEAPATPAAPVPLKPAPNPPAAKE
jgi:lipopolysaccharide export system protein LptA